MARKREIVPIFRIPFDNLTTQEAVERIGNFATSDTFHLVVTVNLDLLVRSFFDTEFHEIIKGADMVTADGMPIVWASRFFPGMPHLKERVTGADMTPLLAELAERKGWDILFFGGDPEDSQKAAEALRKEHPSLKINITHSPFSPLLEIDHITAMEEIYKARPRFLFMFLGEKGEKWATMNRTELGEAGVRMGMSVGATVKFLAGTVHRAPAWMQRSGLEWAFRIYQEPGYLWKRYAKDLIIFSILVARQFFRSVLLCIIFNRPLESQETQEEEILKKTIQKSHIVTRLILKNSLSVRNINELRTLVTNTFMENSNIQILEIDLSHVLYLDSAVMDYFINLHRDLRGHGKILNIPRISPEVAKIFTSSRMHQYLNMRFKIEVGELAERFGNFPVRKKRKSSFYIVTKRGIDAIGGLVGLILFSPIFLTAAILIKLEDGGPIFFKQVRVGKDGIPFYLFKFRSMVINAEALKKDLMAKSEVKGKIFKMKDDPRITKCGKIFRKTSIDELPQFLNLLKGEMSLVGPRPAINYEVAEYSPKDSSRLSDTMPGITGMAQVFERRHGKLDFDRQLELDLKYVEQRNLWLDIKVLFKTIPAVLFPKGAC